MLTTMPILIVMAKLAPKGIEACVYSFLTMATNISFTIGNSLSNVIAAKVGITQTKFDSLWCLIVMSSCCTVVPIFFVWLLPKAIEGTEQVNLKVRLISHYFELLLFCTFDFIFNFIRIYCIFFHMYRQRKVKVFGVALVLYR